MASEQGTRSAARALYTALGVAASGCLRASGQLSQGDDNQRFAELDSAYIPAAEAKKAKCLELPAPSPPGTFGRLVVSANAGAILVADPQEIGPSYMVNWQHLPRVANVYTDDDSTVDFLPDDRLVTTNLAPASFCGKNPDGTICQFRKI
jgi:hypothetical protein